MFQTSSKQAGPRKVMKFYSRIQDLKMRSATNFLITRKK